VKLTPSVALFLREHKAQQEEQRALLGKSLVETDLVFAHPDGRPLGPATLTHAFREIVRKAGVRHVRLHDLRHTHATLMLELGIHPKIVQERQGHSTIATTLDIYSHAVPGLQDAAAKRFEELVEPGGRRMSARALCSGARPPGFEPATLGWEVGGRSVDHPFWAIIKMGHCIVS